MFVTIHFKHFKYGRPVTIISDHKPLVSLFKKSLANSSPRLSRMLLQILDYDLQIMYQEGSKMHLSDALSRLSLHKTEKGSTLPGMDRFFNSSKPLFIEVDVSKRGIGAAMLQSDPIVQNTSICEIPNNLQPISYASKTLSETKSNYSNIEHEVEHEL